MIWIFLAIACVILAARTIASYDDPEWDELYRSLFRE